VIDERTGPPTDVERAYDRWASSYDSDANATRDLDAIVLRAAGLNLSGKRVVEIGAGTGKNTEWIAQQADRVIALDVSAGMLARARVRLHDTSVVLVRCDLHDPWPIATGSVDVVIGNLVLEHIANVDAVFSETARVLTSAGVAFIAELHPARQARGSQAQFTDEASGGRVLVPAFPHTIDEYIFAAERAALDVVLTASHVESGAPDGALPRLLTLLLGKRESAPRRAE
jgi:ubiquinone/menaquinone biosynthesis C-methylase UbiE